MTTNATTIQPVRKTINVKTSVEDAFEVFTKEIDTWWPRTHHIGKAPMKKCIIEGRAGGRCYSEHTDASECDWGRILVWEPPRRFVMAWQISSTFAYEPDVAKHSEVEVRFTPEPDGSTRVDLEHRYLERAGEGAATMRTAVDGPNGWGSLLELFKAKAQHN
jgi:uncharacterized protein YndB with AHSA1/START domain